MFRYIFAQQAADSIQTMAPSVLSNEDMFSLLQACPRWISTYKNTYELVLSKWERIQIALY